MVAGGGNDGGGVRSSGLQEHWEPSRELTFYTSLGGTSPV